MLKKVGALALSINLVACGGKIIPLTDAQKAEVAAVAKDVSDSRQKMEGVSGLTAQSSHRAMLAFTTEESDESPWGDVDFSEACETVSEGFDFGGGFPLAQHSINQRDSSYRTASTVDAVTEIKGDACPVYFKMTMSISATSTIISFDMEIKDAALKEQVEVSKMSFTATMSLSAASMSFDGKGSITSKTHGAISMKLSGSGTENSGTVTETLKFPKYTVEYKTVQSEEGATYYLNGEEVTAAQFQEYRIEMMSQS